MLHMLGAFAMVMALVLITLAQFIESLRRIHPVFSLPVFYSLFAICGMVMVADLIERLMD